MSVLWRRRHTGAPIGIQAEGQRRESQGAEPGGGETWWQTEEESADGRIAMRVCGGDRWI